MPLAASNSNSNGVKSHQLQCVNNGQQQSQQTQQQQQQYTEYTTTNIPAFLSKLWTLVEDTKYDQLIAWDPSGFSFHVYDQTRFAKEILPRFFKHNNMASFIRQLNMYGFRKVNSIDHGSLKNEKEDLEFHHPYFIRGKEQFLEFIKRKVPDIKANPASTAVAAAPSSVNGQPAGGGQATPSAALVAAVAPSSAQPIVQFPGIKQDDLNKVLDDVNSLKSKQKYVDSSLMDVKKENEVLWKEIATLRQKHHHQQQIVNKLIHFLVHLVNPSSLGIKRTRPLMIDSHSANRLANVDVLNGELSDSEDACGGEINEIDDDDEEEFLSNTSSSHHHLDQPPSKKAKVNHSSIYVMPPSNPSSSVVHGSMVNGGSASGGLVNDHKTTKFGPITQNFSPPNGSSSSTSSSSSSAIITNGGGNGNGITSHHHQAYTTANQPGGVVINEIIDSPTSLLGFESANDAKGLTTTNGDFIDTNLFLNANPPNQHQQQSDPIITTPSSPLDDAANLKNGQRANSLTTSASMPVQPTSTMVQTLNEAPPPITLNSIPDGGSEDLSGSQEALIRRSMR